MSYKTRDGKTHQSTVIMGDNGLPIDGIATIAGSYVFLESGVDPLVYTAIAATVTLPVGNDLSPVVSAKPRYTGRYVLITKDNSIYYINRQSIDVANRTFIISRSDSSQITPPSIDLSPGWTVAEADIVNRMATTSSAKIDSVEFRDMQFQMQLDGDPVTIINENGDLVDFATEETQLANNQELQLINDELDTHTVQLQEVNEELDSQTTLLTHIDSDLHTANSELSGINSELDSQTTLLTHIDGDLHTVNSNLDSIELKLDDVNSELDTQTARLVQINSDLNSQSDETQSILQSEFDQTQNLLQTEFDETQVKQDTQISQLTEANSSLNDIELRSLIPLLANANWMKLGNFDNITPSIVGDTLSLNYLEAGANIGKADIRYTSNIDWEINLERYINDTNGDILLDDDNTPLTLD